MKKNFMWASVFILVLSLVSFSSIAYGGKTRSAPAQTEAMSGISETTLLQILKLVGLTILGALVLLIIMGVTNRVVIYYDRADAWWSISPFLFLLVSVIIAQILTPEGQQFASTTLEKAALVAGVVGIVFGIYKTIYNAIRYNRNVALGLFIGIFKVVISLAMAFTAIGSLSSIFDKKTSARGAGIFALVIMLTGFLWVVLINGEKVYNKKGWEIAK